MSMTILEAIKHISFHLKADADCYSMAVAKGYMKAAAGHKRDIDAHQMAITALLEKAEREDPKPLTLEELRQMDGEPVWMVWPDKRIKAKWWIVGNHEWNVMEFDDPIMAKRYGSIWVAYRHKPMED